MPVNPLIVQELRALFKAGATLSTLIRRIMERHTGEPNLDSLVRGYFRSAFHIPMLRVGPDQLQQIARGESLPELNVHYVQTMIQGRAEWDLDDGFSQPCWLDCLSAESKEQPMRTTGPESIPELAGAWNRLDDEARQYIRRIIDNANSEFERATALAALAEQLQKQVKQPLPVLAQSA